jgi:SAM-dependent methyltransferase
MSMSKPVSFWATLPAVSAIPHNHWELPWIMAAIDVRTPCGGMYAWLDEISGNRRFGTAISLGCGNGKKEISLIENGIVDKVVAYDIDPDSCNRARVEAKAKGVEAKLKVVCADALAVMSDSSSRYDLVHWDSSLHHMVDVKAAAAWSWSVLRSGGCFYMNEYVGANRFQWNNLELDAANAIRSTFPENWFKKDNEWYGQRLLSPPPLYLIAADEAPSSSAIGAAVAEFIPGVEYKPMGGIGYYVSMSGLWSSLSLPSDFQYLNRMMAADKIFSDVGMFSYACALAIKK